MRNCVIDGIMFAKEISCRGEYNMVVHKELIISGKFDEKFKRALLDYYSYGFKNLGSYDAKKRQILSEDWMRLNRVYRFCKYKPITYPAYFLLTIVALSRDFSLRGGIDSLAWIGLVRCEQNSGVKGGKGDRRWSLYELTMKKVLEA